MAFRLLIASVCAAFLAILPGQSHAQDNLPSFPNRAQALPETILVPIKRPGKHRPAGWALAYYNGFSGPDVPDREVLSRNVMTTNRAGMPASGVISWEIVRTPNNRCAESCPDIIRVLAVPDGFMAFPTGSSVEEGAGLRIIIAPAGVG